MKKSECPVCGKIIYVHPHESNETHFCSKECHINWQRRNGVVLHCENCDELFRVPQCRSNARFCCKSCATEFMVGDNASTPPTCIKKVCVVCEIEYTCAKSRKGLSKYCSIKCKGKAQQILLKGKGNPFYNKNHSLETRKKMSKLAKGKIILDSTRKKMSKANIKKWQNSEFRKRMSQAQKLRWDKPEEHEKISKVTKGKNNPMYGIRLSGNKSGGWRGGKSFEPYTSEFNSQLKELIRNRDNYECQICGKFETYEGKNLCVHHIDYDKMNSMPDNLVTLCRICHSKTNGNRDYWQDLLAAKLQRCKLKKVN